MSEVTKLCGEAEGYAATIKTVQSGLGTVSETRSSVSFVFHNSDNDAVNATFELVRSGEHHDVLLSGNNDLRVTLEVI